MRILLAEDQAMVRGALAALLGLNAEFQITQAADGDQALALLKQQDFDLLLTDIEMPGRSGLELAAWLQQQKSPTKVVVITTFGRSGYIKRALDCGVSGFLLKDAPVSDLLAALDKVMAGKRVIDSELALLALGQNHSQAKLHQLVAVLWHLGLWCFVWTILAGVFSLPFYYSQLAPIGGQLLIAAWLVCALTAWRRS